MKTKQILFIVALTIAIIFLLSSFQKEEEINKKFLTVKSIESSGALRDSHILVCDEHGKISEVDLKMFRFEGVDNNIIKLTEVLNKIGSRGHDLHSTTSCYGDGLYINTYTFIKK